MAEILGVAASIMSIGSLAIQIVGSIQMMSDYWSSIQDAPQDIESLLEELRLLSSLLADFRGSKEGIPYFTGKAALEALAYCKNAARDIESMTMDLKVPPREVRKGRRRWSAIKFTFSEKKFTKYVNRLERAKSLLSLAQQCCMQRSQIATLEDLQRQDIYLREESLAIASRSLSAPAPTTFESGTQTLQSQPPSLCIFDKRGQLNQCLVDHISRRPLGDARLVHSKSPRRANIGGEEEARQLKDVYVRPNARWLVWRGFEKLAECSYGKWRYFFRSYNIVTFDHPIYSACVSNDLMMVQKLCGQRCASPFDITSDGWTLLHFTAAFAYPELCEWLISQGVDSNTGGGLQASGKNELGIISIFKAGTTPLQAAANCSGRESRKEITDLILTLMMSNRDRQRLSTNIKDRPNDVMDTLRVLVEKGKGDPMISNTAGDTALHLHTGSIEQFNYLLEGENLGVEQSLSSRDSDTIAERHAQWYWPEGPGHARLAFEVEISTLRRGELPTSSKLLLLHESAGHLRYYMTNNNAFNECFGLIQSLIENAVDIHGVYYRDSRYGRTPLAQIPNIVKGFQRIDQGGLEMESQALIPVFGAWLRNLTRAKFDIREYLKVEEEIALQNYAEGQWEPYEFDESLEWRMEWHFSYASDDKRSDQACSVSATYHFRQKPEKYEDIQDDRIQELGSREAGIKV